VAAYEVLLLNTAVPQIQAAQSGDTYVVPRDIAFSAALTLSAGTANGVPYLNGSKVLTTGSALTFDGTALAPDNTTRTLGTSSLRWGTVFATSFADGTDQFIGSSGTTVLVGYGASWTAQSFAIGGSEQMRLTSTGLGIGTSSPGAKLSLVDGVGNVMMNGDQVSWNRNPNTGAIPDAAKGSVILIAGTTGGGSLQFWTSSGVNASGLAERARITSGGDFQTSSGGSVQVGGTAARATTAGTNRVDIFDGTAPVGTLANGVSFYSASGEANVMDAAGNATLLSPHDSETNEWIFRSKHTPTGKVLRIDVERLLRFVNEHFGLDAVKEFVEE
jgi:hypothetical protein